MARIFTAVLVLVSTAAVAMGIEPAGIWKMSANAPDGKTYDVTLAIIDQDGKLSAAFSHPAFGVAPLQDVKLQGDELSFRMPHEKAGYIVFKLKAEGATFKGAMQTRDGEMGAIRGTRVESDTPSVAGTWKLVAKTGNGQDTQFTMELRQAGTKVTGSVVTQNGDRAEIPAGITAGGLVQLRVATDDGSYEVSGELSGQQLKGIYLAPNGAKGSFTGSKQ